MGRRVAFAAALFAVSFGCSSKRSSDDNKVVDPRAADDAGAAQPVDPGPPPGAAVFGMAGVGAVRLSGTSFETLTDVQPIKDVAITDDGTAWVLADDKVLKFGREDTEPEDVTDTESHGSLIKIAGVSADEAYAIGIRGISHFRGGTWTVTTKIDLGRGSTPLRDIAIGSDGHALAASEQELYHQPPGGKFERLDFAKEQRGARNVKIFFEQLSRGHDGTIYVSSSRGLFRFDDGERVPIDSKPEPLARPIRFAAALSPSMVRFVDGEGNLGLVDDGQVRFLSPGEDLPAATLRDLVVDRAGRTYLSTDNGTIVLDRSGAVAVHLRPGSVEALGGTVVALDVALGGPPLPTPGDVRTATIKGRLVRGKTSVAGVELELCEQPATMYDETPCESASYKQRVTTAKGGGFEFGDVPVGTYGFAALQGDRWMVVVADDCCEKMAAGGEHDVGSLVLP